MAGAGKQSDSNFAFARRSEFMLSIALLAVLVVLLIPLPSVLLDMLLALNLGITILLLLVALNSKAPLDFSVFPSVLLLMTLYRLSLNVATTRLILLNGNAGRIVDTFGNYVAGGSLVVGMIIFLILILIQFIVITKGAGRISEVNARFTLDAMPGKQMAIDAELSSGVIDEVEAKEKRSQLAREAEFYGAMDGASKYVRGDAIAGLVITAINLVGGVVLGVTSGVTLAEAVTTYSVLTIGDGLMSQIPALIIATTSGILVTKAASDSSLGSEIGMQMLASRRPLWVGAGILLAVGLAPGLPKLPFLAIAGAIAIFLQMSKGSEPETNEDDAQAEAEEEVGQEEEQFGEFLETDRIVLEIGTSLVGMVDSGRRKGLRERIASLRRDLTRKHGLWVPAIRIRDNLNLPAENYRILIAGREVARSEVKPDSFLAINPGHVSMALSGESTTDPAFGLEATWVSPDMKRRAEVGGFTVVDAPTVLITHLGEVVRRFSHELLSREDLQKMLDKVRETSPTIVDELKPEEVRMGVAHQVLTNLLAERIPITNLPVILESMVKHGPQNKDPDQLTEYVRRDVGRSICDRFRDEQGPLSALVFEPSLEMRLREAHQDEKLMITPQQLEKLISTISVQWQKCTSQNQLVALLCDQTLRRAIRRALERALPELAVVAYTEIPNDVMIEPQAIIRDAEVFTSQISSAGAMQNEATADLLSPVGA